MSKKWINNVAMAATLLSVGLISACGGEAQREDTPASTSSSGGGNVTSPYNNNTNTNTNTNNTTAFMPALAFSFSIAGTGTYTSGVISTDNTLKVRVKPGSAGQITLPTGYSNFNGTYNCLQLTVTALGKSITTPTLAVNGGGAQCQGAPTEAILDFSDRLLPGHGPVTVSVSGARYDFYCQACLQSPWLFNAYPYGTSNCSYYCPLRTVYQTHTITGSLDIQVSGTSL